MFANLCPRTIGINGLNQREMIDLAARYSFGGVDFHPEELKTPDEARSLTDDLQSRNLQWGLFWLPADFVLCHAAEYESNLNRLREMLKFVQTAGCKRTYLHVWPSSELPYEANLKHHLERLGPLARLLSDHGVQLGLEFLGPYHLRVEKTYPFIYRLPEMLKLAETVHESAGVVIDMFHWYCGGGTAEEVRRLLTSNRIVNIHANDARLDIARKEQHDFQRELPLATGVVDTPGLIHALKDLGYTGPIIAEPFHPQLARLEKTPPESAANEISQIMRHLLSY